jgi:hypothetical protein
MTAFRVNAHTDVGRIDGFNVGQVLVLNECNDPPA